MIQWFSKKDESMKRRLVVKQGLKLSSPGATSATHCLTACGQWAVQLLQYTASVPGGRGQWNSCNALSHSLGAVGSATLVIHCHTAWGRWTVELLQCVQCAGPSAGGTVGPTREAVATLRAELLQCTGTPPGDGEQWNSCNALPQCPGAVDNKTRVMHYHTAQGHWVVQLVQCTASLHGGSGQCNSHSALPHCRGLVGSGTPAMCGPISWGTRSPAKEAVAAYGAELLQGNASLPGGSGQCNSCNALPHCLGAVGSGTRAMDHHTAWRKWAVELVQCTPSLPGGSGQCNPCNALPYRLGAVGTGTPAMRSPPAGGTGSPAQEGVAAYRAKRLQCTAEMPRGNGRCDSCGALPYRLGTVGSGTPTMHRVTARGQWVVQLLQCTAAPPGDGGQWNSCNARAHKVEGQGVLPRRWSLPKERNSCNALPLSLGAVGTATRAMHCLTTWGQWAVQLL